MWKDLAQGRRVLFGMFAPHVNNSALLNLAVERAVPVGFAFNRLEIKTGRARVIMFVSGLVISFDAVAAVAIPPILLAQLYLHRCAAIAAVVTNDLRLQSRRSRLRFLRARYV